MKQAPVTGKKRATAKSNVSSGVANCMAIEQKENERSKKVAVTGKITGTKGVTSAPAAPLDEAQYEREPVHEVQEQYEDQYQYQSQPQAYPAGVEVSAKVDKADHYREALQEQVEARRMADAREKELARGGTGLQLGSMSEGTQMTSSAKTKAAARDIQAYNQQLAYQRAQDKAAAKHGGPIMPAAEPMPEPEELKAPEAKGMFETPTMQQVEREIKAAKDEKTQRLKEALEQQIREDKARKLQDKQERMGYKK